MGQSDAVAGILEDCSGMAGRFHPRVRIRWSRSCHMVHPSSASPRTRSDCFVLFRNDPAHPPAATEVRIGAAAAPFRKAVTGSERLVLRPSGREAGRRAVQPVSSTTQSPTTAKPGLATKCSDAAAIVEGSQGGGFGSQGADRNFLAP